MIIEVASYAMCLSKDQALASVLVMAVLTFNPSPLPTKQWAYDSGGDYLHFSSSMDVDWSKPVGTIPSLLSQCWVHECLNQPAHGDRSPRGQNRHPKGCREEEPQRKIWSLDRTCLQSSTLRLSCYVI